MHLHQQLPSIPIILSTRLEAENMPGQPAYGTRDTGCLTLYRTRNFFNNFTTNEDIATKFEAYLPHCVRNVTSS